MKLENLITVTDNTQEGRCSSCGACCSDILPLAEREIIKIKAYMKVHPIKEQRHNVVNAVDLTCPFRDDINRRCLVYEVRPSICRDFLCNYKKSTIAEIQSRHHDYGRVVFMRSEFFNNREDIEWYMRVSGVIFSDTCLSASARKTEKSSEE